ncbi:MAG: Maf family nucleotide pyrophosphatase [Ferruginibacter sp.]
MKKILLASQSPRRKQLLEWADIPFEVVVSHADETYPANLQADQVALFLAKKKAEEIVQWHQPDTLVLTADTIVVCDGLVLEKPNDRTHAIQMLNRLSGNHHQVITGVCIYHEQTYDCFQDITDVVFHALTPAQITYYVDQYKPFDKAGAYGIQEWIGVVGIKQITGDFYNVMGLPVSRVVQKLHEKGFGLRF